MNTEKITEDIQSVQDNIREIKSTWGNTIMTLDNIKSGLKADVQKKVDDAYKRGYNDAKQIAGEEYQRGFCEGYKKCLSENDFDQPCASCNDYQRGLDDAWETAKKIALMDTETSENVTGYFGLFRIMENLTAMQAIDKIKAYEESKNKICVGDIVYFKGKPEIKACVTAINESGMETTFCGIAITNVETYCSVGNPYSFCRTDDWCKTGERFDIEQLWRGEDNA